MTEKERQRQEDRGTEGMKKKDIETEKRSVREAETLR